MGLLGRIFALISGIASINWGLYTLFQINLVEYFCNMLGKDSCGKYIYAFIAVAGIFTIFSVFSHFCSYKKRNLINKI
ncbi:DUF378 domain-containing protein [Candidatus Dependentiae bacterium]|nr:DUF378 domain-containing protein [Candidatus Dependentiae bacterium]